MRGTGALWASCPNKSKTKTVLGLLVNVVGRGAGAKCASSCKPSCLNIHYRLQSARGILSLHFKRQQICLEVRASSCTGFHVEVERMASSGSYRLLPTMFQALATTSSQSGGICGMQPLLFCYGGDVTEVGLRTCFCVSQAEQPGSAC